MYNVNETGVLLSILNSLQVLTGQEQREQVSGISLVAIYFPNLGIKPIQSSTNRFFLLTQF